MSFPWPPINTMSTRAPTLLLPLPFGIMIASWGIILSLFPPNEQDFPLNDDWAYSKGAFTLSRGEGVHYYRQPSMPLLGQWFLAYPVIRIAGESHAALRLFTITLSVLGLLAYYDLMRRETGASRSEAGFAVATLAMNPIYFLMSGTFMSDVPALSLSLVALSFYTRALRSDGFKRLGVGAAMATLAVITRQNAIVTPLVAGILLWRHRRLRWNPVWLVGVWLPVVAGILVHFWFLARPDSVPLEPRLPSRWMVFVLLYTSIHYLGLSVLPQLAFRTGLTSRILFFVALIAMSDGALAYRVFGTSFFHPTPYHGGLFPYLVNTITPWGTLQDGIYLVGERPLMMGWYIQVVLTVLGVVGGAMLAERTLSHLGRLCQAAPLSLFTALHALLLLVSPTLFDRYLIVLMPGAMAVAGVGHSRLRWSTGLGVLALFVVCSVGLMHDWLAWNSARWALGRRALASGIAVADMEGGLEWDGWYAPGPVDAEGAGKPIHGLMLPFNQARFPDIRGRYALAFSEVPDTTVLDHEPYRLWLIPGARRFLLLEQRRDHWEY